MARTKHKVRKSTGGKAPRKPPVPIDKNNLISWLSVNELIMENKTTNNILQDTLSDIIQSLGSIKELFLFIAKSVKYDKSKLELIHKSISFQITKHQNNKNKTELKTEPNSNTKKANKKLNAFNTISNDCVSIICGYFNKKDTERFKMTCRRNAIICLNEMGKSMIGLITNNHIQNLCNLYNFDIDNLMICNRYQLKTKYLSLFEEWSMKYNIPKQNQLLFHIQTNKNKNKNKYTNKKKTKLVMLDAVSMEMQQISKKQRKLLLLDNRKITVLAGDKIWKFNMETDKYENICNYELIILEYFDINTQTMQVVQYILHENGLSYDGLNKYIQQSFIPMDGIDNKWYNKLQMNLQQMSVAFDMKSLRIYQHNTNKNNNNSMIKKVSNNGQYDNFNNRLFSFQLNGKHEWFKDKNKFKDTRLKCAENMNKFYLRCDEMCRDIIYVSIHFKGDINLLDMIVKQKCESKNVQFEFNVNSIKWNKIKMSKTCQSYVLREKISKYLFNGIISAHNIDLFDMKNFQRIKWNNTVSELKNYMVSDVKNIYYSVVLYDTQLKQRKV